MEPKQGIRNPVQRSNLEKKVERLAAALMNSDDAFLYKDPGTLEKYAEFKQALSARILELFKQSPADGLYKKDDPESPSNKLLNTVGHKAYDLYTNACSAEDVNVSELFIKLWLSSQIEQRDTEEIFMTIDGTNWSSEVVEETVREFITSHIHDNDNPPAGFYSIKALMACITEHQNELAEIANNK